MTTSERTGIRLTNLTKSYGDLKAVAGIDLLINPGETLALLGPNGAGKSTTIDMMLGLIRPDAGSVSLFGASPTEAVDAGVVSGMLQTGSLPQYLSVRELVAMMASLYPHPLKVEDALRHAGILEIADRATSKLSGGQTQRVRMAIALIADPEMLVLDEPTAALDVEGRRNFWESIRGVAARGKTIIFATHYLEEADAYADRIILLRHGLIVADGTSSEVKAMAAGRTVRATLAGADEAMLRAIPGADGVEVRGETVLIHSNDSDAVARYLLMSTQARDLEIAPRGLEDAFIALTSDDTDGDMTSTGASR